MVFADRTARLRHFWAKCKIHLGAPPKRDSVLTAQIQQKRVNEDHENLKYKESFRDPQNGGGGGGGACIRGDCDGPRTVLV